MNLFKIFQNKPKKPTVELSIKHFPTCASIFVSKDSKHEGKIKIEIPDKELEQKFINVLKLVK